MNEKTQKYDTSKKGTMILAVDNHFVASRKLRDIVRNSTSSPGEFQQTRDKPFCFECGEQMAEVERLNENGVLFIWYECLRNDCDGQWLQKMSRSILNNSSGGYC
ncbi:MAG: hypothetical protein ACYS1A_12125 [Planctomycetota bacterium]|jgi:hypothetical protein